MIIVFDIVIVSEIVGSSVRYRNGESVFDDCSV